MLNITCVLCLTTKDIGMITLHLILSISRWSWIYEKLCSFVCLIPIYKLHNKSRLFVVFVNQSYCIISDTFNNIFNMWRSITAVVAMNYIVLRLYLYSWKILPIFAKQWTVLKVCHTLIFFKWHNKFHLQ